MLHYSIQYYIRTNRANADGKVPIYLRIRIGQQKTEYSLGYSIIPTQWNSIKQEVLPGPEANLINSVLTKKKLEILKVITDLELSNMTVSLVNLIKLLKGEVIKVIYTLIKTAQEHNSNFEKQIGTRYSYGSYKNYKTTLKYLQEFTYNQYNKRDIPLIEVNHKFFMNYFIWLTTKRTCNHNGAAKHIQRLKRILNYALELGYINTNPAQTFKIQTKYVPKVALTWEEIGIIQNLNLQTDRLRQIRDIFIFQVFTGLAYSDVKSFSRHHLSKGHDDKYWIRMERTKTHNTFAVPLLAPALDILHKYMDSAEDVHKPIFAVLSNQKMNYNLKIIQEVAGISKPLHTHLPRHTFATTVTLQLGVPIETVSKMLGHAKLTMTQTYAKVGELKISTEMSLLEEKLKNRNRKQS